MKILIDVPERTIKQIKDVVESEGYEDPEEFVETAIKTQVKIEEGQGKETGIPTLDEAIDSVEDENEEEEGTQPPGGEDQTGELVADGLGRREYQSLQTVSAPNESRITGGPLWGQYNRIFPVKLLVRRLANYLDEQNSATAGEINQVDLKQFQSGVANLARNYGLKIRKYDKDKSRKRGERLSSGLPTGDDAEKSKDRFITHFVGYSDRNKKLTGASPNLYFVNITEEDPNRIGLTSPGLEFARLYNPLIDDGADANQALANDEREFYLNHVRANLPEEFEAMVLIAGAIHEGDNRPEILTERVEELNSDWSGSQANTIRSGLVSRMFELGFLERHRVGQRGIAYDLTERGKQILSNNQGVAYE